MMLTNIPDFSEKYPDSSEIENIEFGAGKGYFGKIEFPQCYLTDITYPSVKHHSIVEDPTLGNCHFLDGLADYFNHPFEGRTFNNLIFCNPFYFGFNGKTETKRFILRAEELLVNGGQLFFLGQKTNPWVKKEHKNKWLEHFNKENTTSQWEFQNELTHEKLEEFNNKHTFRQSTGETIYVTVGYVIKRIQ